MKDIYDEQFIGNLHQAWIMQLELLYFCLEVFALFWVV